MAIFDEEELNNQEEFLINAFMRDRLPGETDDDYINALKQKAQVWAPVNIGKLSKNTSNKAIKEEAYSENILGTAEALGQSIVESGSPEGIQFRSPVEDLQEGLVDTEMHQVFLRDPKLNVKARRQVMHDLAFLSRGEYNAELSFKRWLHRNDEQLSAADASELAKYMGADIKFEEPQSVYNVDQAVFLQKRKELLEGYMANLGSTGSLGRLNDITVMAAGMAGAIGPVEAITSVGLGMWVPEMAVANVAKGAGLVRNALNIKKVTDAAKQVKTLKTLNTVAKGAASAAGTAERESVAVMLKEGVTADKALAQQEKLLKASQVLEDIEGMSYGNLAWQGKAVADTVAFGVADLPWILASRTTSKDLNLDIYSDKDMYADMFFAGAMGIALPGALRWAGHKFFKWMPQDMVNAKLSKLERDIEVKEALGEISEEVATEGRQAIKDIREASIANAESFKNPHRLQVESANQLSKTNITNEELYTALEYMKQQMIAGNVPKISELPFFTSRMSHVSVDVLEGLNTRSIRDVFGDNVLTLTTKSGLEKMGIDGETGLLGQLPVTGFLPGETEERLAQLYRAYALDNPKDAAAFKDWVQRFNQFTETLADIQARDKINIQANAAARSAGKDPAITAANQVDKYAELREAYLRYALGDETFDKAREIETRDRALRAIGEPGEKQSDEFLEAEAGFKEWFDKYVKTTTEETKEGYKVTYYDFIDEAGQKDYGRTFESLISDLREAAAENSYFGNLDNLLIESLQDQVRESVEHMSKLDVSPDTTDTMLMGIPRIEHEVLQEIDKDLSDLNSRLSLARIEYASLKNSEVTKDAFSTLENFSVTNRDTGSIFTRAEEKIKNINDMRQKGFREIVPSLLEKLHGKETSQVRITNIMGSTDTAYVNKQLKILKKSIRDSVKESMDELPIGNILSPNEKADIARTFADFVEEEARRDSKVLDAFLNPEQLGNVKKIEEPNPETLAPGTSLEEKASVTASAEANLRFLTEPLQAGLERALGAVELQEYNNIRIATNKMRLMRLNPAIAAEVITGSATQSHYAINGVHHSVEAQTKTSTAFVHDIFNELKRMDTTDGTDMLSWARDEKNFGTIQDALIKMSYGEEYKANDKAARVAKVILDRNATFASSFRDLGALSPVKMNSIKRDKLRYADVAVTDAEVDEFAQGASRALDLTPEDVLRGIERDDMLNILYGNEWINEEVARRNISRAVRDMQNILQDFASIEDTRHRNTAIWALRDFDLDKMFDTDGNSYISLNEIRDAVLNGDILKLIGNDLYNIINIRNGLATIERELLGTDLKPGKISSDGRVFTIRSNVHNLAASVTGKQAAALNSLGEDFIHFKNADAEIAAAHKFGYDTVDDMLHRNFSSLFNAYFALKEFGSSPGAMVDMLVETYNGLVRSPKDPFRKTLEELSGMAGRDFEKAALSKYVISEGAHGSSRENVAIACGLHNQAPSSAVRIIKALSSFLSSSLLMKAGLKSFADYGTIWQGLMINAMAQGRIDAVRTTSKAAHLLSQYKDVRDLFLAAGIIEKDQLVRYMTNDPSIDPVRLSSEYSFVDKIGSAAQWYSNLLMNGMGKMELVTNSNKAVAAGAIQLSYGKFAHIPYAELPENLRLQFLREGFEEADWDFIRQHLIVDVAEYIRERGIDAPSKDSFKILIPQRAMDLNEDVVREELQRRGVRNINANVINKFKEDLLTKTWVAVDSSADEMISMPSQRVASWMRAGKARNSGGGIAAEIITMFQSFGASLLYNTYFKYFTNFAGRETGITVMDLFNPNVKLAKTNRPKMFMGTLGMLANIAMITMAVDTGVAALAGQVQSPVGKDGKLHPDMLTSSMFGALGTMGVLLDAAYEGVEGSGQRGGGFSVQVAPSVSNALRVGYRMLKPLRSTRVRPEDKPLAVFAGATQELARWSGIRSMPLIGPVWQGFFGSYLDMLYSGGETQYKRQLKQRENRGYVPMPWETGQPLGGLLQ